MTYASEVAADSPVLNYKFESNLTDAGSLAVNGSGSVSYGSGGLLGQYLDLSGTQTFSVSTSSTFMAAKNFSVEAWVKHSSTGFTGYQYVFLRDGTHDVLVAMGGTDTGNNGKIYFYAGGSGQNGSAWSTVTVNDAAWHHIVCTLASDGALKIWIDGVDRTSIVNSQLGTLTNTGNFVVGGATSSTQRWVGQIDELAFYSTTLSSTRVGAHYSAATSASVTIDVDTATSTAQAQDASITLLHGLPVDLTAVTASAQAYDTTVETETVYMPRVVASTDYVVSGGVAQDTNPMVLDSQFDKGVFTFTLPSDMTNTGLHWAKFEFDVSTSGAGTDDYFIAQITAPITDITSLTLGTPLNMGVPAIGNNLVDITSIFNRDNFYGLVLYRTGTASDKYVISTEDSTSSNKPALNFAYEIVAQDVDWTADVPTATAQTQDVTVNASTDTSVSTVTASLSAYDVTVEVAFNPNFEITVDTVTASVQAHDAAPAINIDFSMPTATASVLANDVTTEETTSADIELDTPRILWTHIGLTDVNGEPIVPTEEEDKYFVSTMRNITIANTIPQRGSGSAWFRFNETSGTEAIDRTERWTGAYENVVLGQNDGPNGRKYVGFTGNSLFHQIDAVDFTDELYAPNGTLEFSIRTDKKNQFVLRMDDIQQGVITNTDTPPRDLYLKDGKLNYRVWGAGTGVGILNEFTGFTDIADGDWHHIVMASSITGTGKVDIYIDGDLEIRRNTYGFSFPDYIGGRPGYQGWPSDIPVPQADWFVGDITEVVFYNGMHLNQDQVFVQKDNLFGFDPVYVESARLTATAYEATVRANAKRVFTLNMGTQTKYLTAGPETFAFSGLAYPGSTPTNGVKVGNYQFFQYSAFDYLDAVTDEYRLIDLDVDVNLDDFDIINVINFPQASDDWSFFDRYDRQALFGGLTGRQQVEQVVSQIKAAVVAGKGLFLTDPSLAVAMGIIDDVEYVPHLREPRDAGFDYGSSPATYDYRSAIINPWGENPNGNSTTIWTARPTFNPNINYENLAHYYDDEHSNNAQRVVSLVDGLTDVPGSILVDSIAFWGYMGNGEMHAEKYAARPSGLLVGDEFRLMGTPQSGRGSGWNNTALTGGPVSPFMRPRGFVAAPVSAVKAGTVVTTFGAHHWLGDEQVENPYRDFAVSVVVRPGDTLGGQVVQGRIFMNFTESFADMAPTMMHGIKDVIPDGVPGETAESLEWDWSMWRGTWAGSTPDNSTQSVTVNPDGSLTIRRDGGDLIGITYTSRWPLTRIETPTMHYRGLKWLASDATDGAGNAVVGVATATGSARAYEPTTEASKSVDIDLSTARVISEALPDKDSVDPDAEVLVLTAEVVVRAQPFTERVDLSTAQITARAHEDLDGIMASADLVVLRLPGSTAILTLEER